ncbi:hypothetical protein AB0O64_34740 [Streptomyces sp. NPDC088341]|uniref:hypothetical protein n=1 Tax=Streptomyces sp. NPDC088341 TaxID=3154870 RepID=UPI003420E413
MGLEVERPELVQAESHFRLALLGRDFAVRDGQAELAAETRRFFHRRQRQPHIVHGYFRSPHVRYVIDE